MRLALGGFAVGMGMGDGLARWIKSASIGTDAVEHPIGSCIQSHSFISSRFGLLSWSFDNARIFSDFSP